MTKNKRSQITLFIIVGIIMVALIGFMLYLGYQQIKKEMEKGIKIVGNDMDIAALKTYINSCIKDKLTYAVYKAGIQGGHINLGNDYFSADILKVAYFEELPAKEEAEQEIALYTTQILPSCLNDYAEFKKMGKEIKQKQITSVVSLNEKDVSINVKLGITITTEGKEQKIEDFRQTADVRLKRILEYLTVIKESTNPDIDLTYLNSLDINSTVVEKENAHLYFFRDPYSRIGKADDYRFVVARKI